MSRLTFRDKQPDTCWQKIKRDKYNSEGVPPVPHLDIKRAVVRKVSRKLAEQIILKYEWLGTMSSTKWHYGIFFGDYCAGVTCIGQGATMAGTAHHQQFNIQKNELLTLARGACVHWAPKGSNSKLVSWTCKLLAKDNVGKLIWATSDTDAGEIGTIYQACGWTYIGTTNRGKEAEIVSPRGRVFNNRMISSWAKKRGVTYSKMRGLLLDGGWVFQESNPKHRYAKIIDIKDKGLKGRIEQMRKPYPKRLKQAMGSFPESQQRGSTDSDAPIIN